MKFLTSDQKNKIARLGRVHQSFTVKNYEGNPKKTFNVKVVSYEFKLYWVESIKEEGKETLVLEVYALD